MCVQPPASHPVPLTNRASVWHPSMLPLLPLWPRTRNQSERARERGGENSCGTPSLSLPSLPPFCCLLKSFYSQCLHNTDHCLLRHNYNCPHASGSYLKRITVELDSSERKERTKKEQLGWESSLTCIVLSTVHFVVHIHSQFLEQAVI